MQKILKLLSLLGKFAGVVAGLGAYTDQLPAKWANLGFFIFAGASILKDAVNRAGDLLDDGKANDSFKP